MPQVQKRKTPRKSTTLSFRLSQEQMDEVVREADKAGWTLSQYARARFLGHRIRSREDSAAIRDLRRLVAMVQALTSSTPDHPAPVLDASAVASLLEECRQAVYGLATSRRASDDS